MDFFNWMFESLIPNKFFCYIYCSKFRIIKKQVNNFNKKNLKYVHFVYSLIWTFDIFWRFALVVKFNIKIYKEYNLQRKIKVNNTFASGSFMWPSAINQTNTRRITNHFKIFNTLWFKKKFEFIFLFQIFN